MAGGGQVGRQNQNQTTSQQSSGSYSGTTGSTGTSTYTPTPTTGWGNANNTAGAALGTGGITPDQQKAIDFVKYQQDNQPINWALNDTNNNITSILGTNVPGVETSNVEAQTAASLMSPYEGRYASAVLDPSLAAFDRGAAIQANANRARRNAGSAFGARSGVADDTFGIGAAEARGMLAGNITGQGLQWAGGMGAGDAGNLLSASGQNAGNRLAMTSANASNALTGRQQALLGEQQRAANLQAIQNNGMASAAALYGMSGGGIDQLLKYMGGQVPAFGTSTDTSGSTTASGSSQSQGTGTGQSSGSSKGGGISGLF